MIDFSFLALVSNESGIPFAALCFSAVMVYISYTFNKGRATSDDIRQIREELIDSRRRLLMCEEAREHLQMENLKLMRVALGLEKLERPT